MTSEERDAYRRGRQGFERGDDDAVLSNLGKLLSTRRTYADVHYMVGVTLERRGDLDAAAHSLEEALRINPGYAEAVLALSSVYERQGEFARARDLALRARERRPEPGPGVVDPTTRGKIANLQAAVGDAHREVGELREAVAAYRKAIDRCPQFHDIRHRLAMTLRDAGVPDQAIREFQRVLRSNPHFLDAAVQLGLTYFTLGQTDRAVAEWDAVLERDPGRDDARMYLRMVRAHAAENA